MTRDFLGRPISTRFGREGRLGGALWYPLMDPGQSPGDDNTAKLPEAPISSKELILWNHKLLIKIFPPQPIMKVIQHIFPKILPKLEFKVNLKKKKKNWSLSDWTGLKPTTTYLVHKQTLNHLAKLGSSCGFESRCSQLKIFSKSKISD